MNNTICVVICGMLTIVEKMLNGQDLIVSGFGNYFCAFVCVGNSENLRVPNLDAGHARHLHVFGLDHPVQLQQFRK